MRKVNKDTRGNNQQVKVPKVVTKAGNIKHQTGDPKPTRVAADWAVRWGAGWAPWEMWDGLLRQGRGEAVHL